MLSGLRSVDKLQVETQANPGSHCACFESYTDERKSRSLVPPNSPSSVGEAERVELDWNPRDEIHLHMFPFVLARLIGQTVICVYRICEQT